MILMMSSLCLPAFAEDTHLEMMGEVPTGDICAKGDSESVMEPKSEYQMALEETQRLESIAQEENSSENSDKTPIEEYKEAFDARAEMSPEILCGMGYSADEIEILQRYKNGECSFEEAATRAAAVLTPNLKCTKHTTEKYIVEYSWEWDKTPVGLGEDGFALGLYGIDSQSVGFVTKLNSSTAAVTYCYTDGTYYKVEYPTTDVSTNAVSTKFDSYKLSDSGDRWVWAKRGYIIMNISPAVSGGKTFAAVRAAGEYGHSSKSSSQIDISVSVDVLSGSITATFSISPSSSGTVTPYGKKQSIFYNDGSEHVEA